MSSRFTLTCIRCSRSVDLYQRTLKCVNCGGQLIVNYNYEAIRESVSKIFNRQISTMWKYAPLLPLLSHNHIVSLGEGGTRLLKATNLARHLGMKNLFLKVEAWNPTGSHKDRQISLATSRAVELGYRVAVTSSSGNVGASMAAYTSKAGIKGIVFVPRVAPGEKLIQIAMYGAHVSVVDTTSNIKVVELVSRLVQELGLYNMVTAGPENPYTLEGGRTIAFEIFEQMESLPEVVVTPVGGGGLIASVWKGFSDLLELGLIRRDEIPRLVGVQADGCAPFVRAIREGWSVEKTLETPWKDIRTICTAIADTIPLDASVALEAVRKSGGTAISVSDDETIEAGMWLSSMEGVFAEPSSNTCIAALKRLVEDGWIESNDSVVALVTGAGFKDLHTARRIVKPVHKIEPSFEEMKRLALDLIR
ncbi:MAG: threonine synthase [Nitrososphaerota archaeon]